MSACEKNPTCTGCSLWHLSYEKQKNLKEEHFKKNISNLSNIDFISCGEHSLRQRVDFTVQFTEKTNAYSYGFYDQQKNLLDIKICPQLSPALQRIYDEFRLLSDTFLPRLIRKGSVRLRAGPNNEKRIWFDFSNIDIKNLLDESQYLKKLIEADFLIEMGQKAKSVKLVEEKIKLADPQPSAVFKTLNLELQGFTSGFTQVSWLTADRITERILEWLNSESRKLSVVEFGSGIGQYTLPILKAGHTVHAYEFDKKATENLEHNCRIHSVLPLLNLHVGDFHSETVSDHIQADVALVNPARSGLKKFTSQLLLKAPKQIVYVSCYPQTLAEDLTVLTEKYDVARGCIIDQFPQTEHYEAMVELKLKSKF